MSARRMLISEGADPGTIDIFVQELAETILNYVITPSGHPSYDDGKYAGLDLAADLIKGIL